MKSPHVGPLYIHDPTFKYEIPISFPEPAFLDKRIAGSGNEIDEIPNIVAQNVNKAFVYISDCNLPLR